MELKIIEEKENPLFNRKESQLRIQAKITPSRAEVAKSVSEKFSTSIENIEIKKIAGKFGSNFFNINVFIYDSKEDRMSTEKKPKLIIEQKTEDKKVESQQSEITDNADTNKDEGDSKINENADNELPNKDDSERNESEANQNKGKIEESAKS